MKNDWSGPGSNIYLHYVLDLWFEKVVKTRLKGEAYLIRYIDDFIGFQYRSDANRFNGVLEKRLGKFSLTLEPNKTIVEFGRFATRHAQEKGKKLEAVYFLGFTHYCTRNRKGNFMVGRKTEKTRLRRSYHQDAGNSTRNSTRSSQGAGICDKLDLKGPLQLLWNGGQYEKPFQDLP
ncbi:MAG: hypothetical protein RJR37_07070 [Peptococcaceae bacterium MAG4]|jgi:hypothetical protein|nr:hypothetical protein [Peptococcaceae bacterium MAG4]